MTGSEMSKISEEGYTEFLHNILRLKNLTDLIFGGYLGFLYNSSQEIPLKIANNL